MLVVAEDWAAELEAAGIRTATDLNDLEGGQDLPKATLGAWRSRTRINLERIGTCYLKRYHHPPASQQLRRILSGSLTRSTARTEWDQIGKLQSAGVGTVTALAFSEKHIGVWEEWSSILLRELPGKSLEAVVLDQPQRFPRRWAERLAAFIADFHRAGFIHRDLYLCHIFVELQSDQPIFRLIDLARLFRPRWRRQRWLVKDLASLNYSTPPAAATSCDRLRFFKTYLGVARLQQSHRAIAKKIVQKTKRIAQHDRTLQAASGGVA